MKGIHLANNRAITFVDDEDFGFLNRFNWRLIKNGGNEYAYTNSFGGVLMHVLILLPAPPFIVRHLDDMGLHNVKSNLKIASQSENVRNALFRQVNKKNNLPRGVTKHPSREGYRARITVDQRQISLGFFKSIDKAATVYEDARRKYFGNDNGA